MTFYKIRTYDGKRESAIRRLAEAVCPMDDIGTPKLTSQGATSFKTVEEVLSSQGVLTTEQIAQLRLDATEEGKSISQLIIERRLANEEDVTRARAQVLGIPYVTLVEKLVQSETLNLIPQEVARRYYIFPFEKDEEKLHLAMLNPNDISVVEFVEKKTGLQVVPYLVSPTQLTQALAEKYTQALSAEVSAALKEVQVSPEVKVSEGEISAETPVTKIVSTLLEYAMKVRATDIHIEPQEGESRVRFRIDGILHEKLLLPKKIHDSVISRIKILGDMKIDEKRIPQDARFSFKIGAQAIDLRVSTLPTIHGEKVELRLLPKSGGVPTLPELGLRGASLRNLEIAITKPHGIILICGPTGSGKTTTLYSILSKLNSKSVNIITLEDPVEYQIPGVNQVQINPAAGLTFATGLRAIVRQDPQIMMVGEIRDFETAELAIHAALTGHLVFSTVHTNNAAGAVPRILDIGAEPYLVASSVTCIVGQRVVRRVCPYCKVAYERPPEVVEDLKRVLGPLLPSGSKKDGQKKDVVIYKGKGCRECDNSGYLGRIGIFEVMPMSEKITRMILERTTTQDLEKKAISEGMITLKQDGYLKVLEGITTIEEVLRVAEE